MSSCQTVRSSPCSNVGAARLLLSTTWKQNLSHLIVGTSRLWLDWDWETKATRWQTASVLLSHLILIFMLFILLRINVPFRCCWRLSVWSKALWIIINKCYTINHLVWFKPANHSSSPAAHTDLKVDSLCFMWETTDVWSLRQETLTLSCNSN